MVGIKETPTNFRVYYTSMKNAYTHKKEEAITFLESSYKRLNELYETVCKDFNANKKDYTINLNDYPEFKNNKYENGNFLRVAKGILANRKGNYELVGRNFDIYSLAKLQKDIADTENNIVFYNKLLNLTCKEYNALIKKYYVEVQRKLILDGYGYVFAGMTGWVCINRCKLLNHLPHIDFKATKERKAKLLAEGKKLYNKEEAEWCKANGIEYNAEDGRVYQNVEYAYEIPILESKVKNGANLKFTTSDYRGTSVRGKKNADLFKEAEGDKDKICNLDVDIRTKLYLCLEADDTLYNKFIRNETQKASVVRQTNR